MNRKELLKNIDMKKAKSGKVLIPIPDSNRVKVVTINNDPSKTDQSQKKEADVNNIMAKYIKTGIVNHLNRTPGQYADTSQFIGMFEGMV